MFPTSYQDEMYVNKSFYLTTQDKRPSISAFFKVYLNCLILFLHGPIKLRIQIGKIIYYPIFGGLVSLASLIKS